MATRMCLMVAAAFVFCTSMAQAGPVFDEDPYIVVDLVPDIPGPYYGGEEVGVDVWLRAENSDEDLWLRLVRFAFGDSDAALTLDPTFTFDFSSLVSIENYYEIQPLLPRPYIYIFIFGENRTQFLHLQGHEEFHIGNINVTLPEEQGRYTLDLLTPHSLPTSGAVIETLMYGHVPVDFYSTSGNLQGGTFDFEVVPEPTSLTLILAALIGLSHKRRVRRRSSHGRSASPGHAALLAAFVCLAIHGPVPAQGEIPGIPTQVVPLNVDSGVVSATGAGSDPVVVFSQVVSVDGASWMRLHFAEVVLSGSHSTDNASFLRLSSLTGGTAQVLHADGLGAWANGSAAFNGHAVLSSQLDLGAATWRRACV